MTSADEGRAACCCGREQTPRQVVRRTILFDGPDRLPRAFPDPYGNDFCGTGMDPSPDARPREGRDEWGAVWHNVGVSGLGEVKEPPLQQWSDFATLSIPDIEDPQRWRKLPLARAEAADRFLLAGGISIYERAHFLRGLENLWADIYEAPDRLDELLSLLTEMNLTAIRRYAAAGVDGFFFCDDWGLQDRLMISPSKWRQIWQPHYARIYGAAHEAGILTFLHSCGNIVDILDDLIDAGLDVIQMDQQENMGLELLGERFRGRISFWCPVDIQKTMQSHDLDEIRGYCRRLVENLGIPGRGGFLPKHYGDLAGAGHRQEAVDAMCEEFLRLSREIHGR